MHIVSGLLPEREAQRLLSLVPIADNERQNLGSYLLRCVLKATTGLGRNNVRISEMMVPTSCRAKSNNIVAGNKLNSEIFSLYSLAYA